MSAPSSLSPRLTIGRIVLFGALLLFAAFFLTPLYVMLSTSLKTMDEIRNGTLLSPPMTPLSRRAARAGRCCTVPVYRAMRPGRTAAEWLDFWQSSGNGIGHRLRMTALHCVGLRSKCLF